MTTSRFGRAAVGLAAALASVLVAPSPAHAATVGLNVSRTSAPPTTQVVFSGAVLNAGQGSVVRLQRRLGTEPWSLVKSVDIAPSGLYSISAYAVAGTYMYRSKVTTDDGSSYSPTRTVTGTYDRNISLPAAGAPFTMTARAPQGPYRVVKVQSSPNGSSWTDRGQVSSAGGLTGIRVHLPSTSQVRLMSPASGSLPKWVGPIVGVTVGNDPTIKKILDDTNNYRAQNGKPALALHPQLNTIAGDWAYQMHQSCTFFHNPSYTATYPSGWRRAGENIAAGQTLLGIVTAWINSLSHRANLLGDYTHIGIGYYEGSQCYGRYWVQNFAKL